jgi:hypothetical protein
VKIKKSQLKELIRQAIVEDIMDKEIKNPKTGNMIKVRTALQLPDEHPANKKAKDMVAKTPTDDKSKKKKGFLSKLSKLNPFSKKEKEKPDSLVPDKPSFLGGDTKVGEKAEQTHNRVGEFIDDNEGNIPEEYVDKLKDLQKRASDIGLSIFNNDGRAPEGTTNKIKELDAEAQEMMDNIEQKAMDGEFDESIQESKKRRFTVKEVRMWMKKLEENRYKKVYNSDARRVAWMVNNEGVELSEMPKSMSKKWTKAQYGRERYLATEFLKSKSEQMTEGKLTEVSAGVNVFYFYKKAKKDKNKFFKMLSDFRKKHSDTKWMKMLNYALVDFNENPKKYKTIDDKQNKLFKNLQQNKKVYEGKLTSEQKLREQIREIIKEQLNEAITGSDRKILFILVREIVRNLKSKIKNFDVNNKSHLNRVGSSILAIIRAMSYSPDNVNYKNFKKYFPKNFNSKLIQKKLKQFHSQNDKVQVTLVTQAIKNELGAGVNEEKLSEQKLMKILLNKKDMSKLQKAMKKYPFKSLPKFKQKGNDIELNVPKKEYNKAVEFLMKNKLNPRG